MSHTVNSHSFVSKQMFLSDVDRTALNTLVVMEDSKVCSSPPLNTSYFAILLRCIPHCNAEERKAADSP